MPKWGHRGGGKNVDGAGADDDGEDARHGRGGGKLLLRGEGHDRAAIDVHRDVHRDSPRCRLQVSERLRRAGFAHWLRNKGLHQVASTWLDNQRGQRLASMTALHIGDGSGRGGDGGRRHIVGAEGPRGRDRARHIGRRGRCGRQGGRRWRICIGARFGQYPACQDAS